MRSQSTRLLTLGGPPRLGNWCRRRPCEGSGAPQEPNSHQCSSLDPCITRVYRRLHVPSCCHCSWSRKPPTWVPSTIRSICPFLAKVWLLDLHLQNGLLGMKRLKYPCSPLEHKWPLGVSTFGSHNRPQTSSLTFSVSYTNRVGSANRAGKAIAIIEV